MLYAIIGEDISGSLELRMGARPSHIARLQELQNAGRLLLAGPMPAIDSSTPGSQGFTGSLIVAEFSSLVEAQRWADDDPYIKAGVYKQVTVKPFIKALP